MGDNSTSGPVVVSPPACLLKPLKVPEALLMGPGPSNASPRVLTAGNHPVTSHMYKYLWKVSSLRPFFYGSTLRQIPNNWNATVLIYHSSSDYG